MTQVLEEVPFPDGEADADEDQRARKKVKREELHGAKSGFCKSPVRIASSEARPHLLNTLAPPCCAAWGVKNLMLKPLEYIKMNILAKQLQIKSQYFLNVTNILYIL